MVEGVISEEAVEAKMLDTKVLEQLEGNDVNDEFLVALELLYARVLELKTKGELA